MLLLRRTLVRSKSQIVIASPAKQSVNCIITMLNFIKQIALLRSPQRLSVTYSTRVRRKERSIENQKFGKK